MKILQQPVTVKRGSRVVVTFSEATNIFLMTEVNFKRYKDGSSYRRLGGKYKKSPAEFTAPYDGTWHVVIEKGSHFSPLNVTGSVDVRPPKRKEVVYFDEKKEWEADHSEETTTEVVEEEKEEKIEVKDEVESEEPESEKSDLEEDEEDEKKD